MRVNSFFLIVLISVLGTGLGYKLRRDITKIRHYCKEICSQCGGEAALSRDVCVCNIEEAEGEEVQHCLERARNKFDFLGIKLETDNRLVNKRSVYRPHHAEHPDDHGSYLYMEQNQEKRPLFKRSSLDRGSHKRVDREQQMLNDGGTPEMQDRLRSKRSFDDYGSRFDITRFVDMFQPADNYPNKPTTNFKILLGPSKQSTLNSGLYYDRTAQTERGDDENCSEEENGSRDNDDYVDGQIALTDELDLRRLDNHQTNMYELIPPPDVSHIDEATFNEFNSIWDSVFSELSNPDYYVPGNFADNIMFL